MTGRRWYSHGSSHPSSLLKAHPKGFAADFICSQFGTPLKIVQALAKSKIKFDQLIMEQTWVHVSFAPAMRQQILTATFTGGVPLYKELV